MAAPSWEEWGKAAFDRAAAEDKPILLALTSPYPWSCQLMDRDCWSDPEIIELAIRNYVPVRVIVDLRPDIFDRYTAGTVPSTVFLTPQGQLLWGGGFLPPHELKQALARLHAGYAANKERLQQSIRERDALINRVKEGQYEGKVVLSDEILTKTIQGIIDTFDAHNGGFGHAPKTPLASSLEVLLLAVKRKLHPEAKPVLTKTLDAIIKGLWDPIDGGFFAMARTEQWTQPETEKVLVNQAALIPVLADAGTLLKNPSYLDIARRAIEYVVGILRLPGDTQMAAGQVAAPEYYVQGGPGRKTAIPPTVPVIVRPDAHAMFSSALIRCAPAYPKESWLAVAGEAQELLDSLAGGPVGQLLRDTVAIAEVRQATHPRGERANQAASLLAKFRELPADGLLDRVPHWEVLGELSLPKRPIDENSRGAKFLVGLGRKDEARAILESFPDFGIDYGHMTAEFALAVDALLG